jgi:hypothetical protein
MKHKSGLHKKVSSIFGGISLPDNSSPSPADKNAAGVNSAETSAANSPVSGIDRHFAGGYGKQSHQASAPEPKIQTVAKVDGRLTEDQEYAASQRRKLFLVIGLCGVFALVLFFFYRPGLKKVPTGPKTSSQSGIVAKDAEIWPEPEPWSANIRDPMVLGASPVSIGGLALKGIVYPPQGRPSVLIGTEICYEGDIVKGTNWTVMKIFLDSVTLQNPDGEEKKITMEGR